MKVRDLIEVLQQVSPDCDVLIKGGDEWYDYGLETVEEFAQGERVWIVVS